MKPNILTTPSVVDQFGFPPKRKLKPGQVEIPTKLMELNYSNERNYRDLEKPLFLHTKEKVRNENEASARPLKGVKLGNTVKKENVTDIKKVKKRLANLRSAKKLKKLKACKYYKIMSNSTKS